MSDYVREFVCAYHTESGALASRHLFSNGEIGEETILPTNELELRSSMTFTSRHMVVFLATHSDPSIIQRSIVQLALSSVLPELGLLPVWRAMHQLNYLKGLVQKLCRAFIAHPKINPSNDRVIAAALRLFGVTYALSPPNRHNHVIQYVRSCLADPEQVHTATQGFIDAQGRFLDRRASLIVARQFNQIIRDNDRTGDELYSEHLW